MKHSKRIFIALCGLLLLLWQPYHSKAQTSYSYGTSASENFRASAYDATSDTYLMGGKEDSSFDHGLLAKLNAAGTPVWVKEFTHTQSMDIRDIHMKTNGNAVILALTTNTSVSRYDALVMEVNPLGNVVWSKTYVNTGLNLFLKKIKPLSSGDYILLGQSTINDNTSSTKHYLTMMKIDAGGTVIWTRRELNPNNQNLVYNDAIELSSGSLLATGHGWHTVGSSGSYHNGYLSKIDLTDGKTTWHKIYPSPSNTHFWQPYELASGDVAILADAGGSNTEGFITYHQLFITVDSTSGAVLLAKDYDFPGGQNCTTFKVDPNTENFLFAGDQGATAAASDRNSYFMELTNDGSFVNAYKYDLSDYEAGTRIELNDDYIHLFSTTKSFPADPSAAANNDFAMFSIDRTNPLLDCNISQLTASPLAFSFSTLESITLSEDGTFTITEASVTLTVDDPPFQQSDICGEFLCELVPEAFIEGCDGMGTVDIADDILSIAVNATATNPGASGMFNAFDATSTLLGTFSYGSGGVVTVPYAHSLDIYFEDADDATCDSLLTLDNIALCSPLPDPIPCGESSVLFQVKSGNEFRSYDPATQDIVIISTNPYQINAIGYNVEDEYIYGIKNETTELVRVGADGVYVSLGTVANLPSLDPGLDNAFYYAGDFDLDGNLYVSSPTQDPTGFYKIDVDVFPLTSSTVTISNGGIIASSDIAYIPSSTPGQGAFYGLTDGPGLYSITPSGIRTGHGPVTMPACSSSFGAQFADAAGDLYAFCNETGHIFKIDVTTTTGVSVDVIDSFYETDGASCPYGTFTQPIPCEEASVFYQTLNGSHFVEYNPNTLSYDTIYSNPYRINAIGYNTEDGFIYGIRHLTNHLVRVGLNGIFDDLGPVANLSVPPTESDSWYAGDFDSNGNLFVSVIGDPNLYKIDVDVFPFTANAVAITGGVGTTDSGDFSFYPSEGAFYGLSENKVLYSISTAGVKTVHGTVNMPSCSTGYGGSYVDATGALYFFCNGNGDLFQVDKTALTGTLLDATGINLQWNDGASCPDGVFCEPSLTCQDDINVTLDGTACDMVVDYELDARVCLGYTLTQTAGFPSGSAFPLGTTVVTYELTNGEETLTCSFNVNVSNVAPTAADYVLSGHTAAIAGEENCYQLTTDTTDYQKGSIYYQSKLNLDYDFQLDFEINLGSVDADGADGMMFILQPISSSLGTSGGSLGFGGIGASVGIEFDTWQNSFTSDPQNDHISFQKNGNLKHNTTGYLDATVIRETVPNMEVGSYRPVTITWNAVTKELTYIYNNRPARTVTQDIANTIFGGNPNVFWGWSASTTTKVNDQSVCITNVSFVEGLTVDATITDVSCEEEGMIDLTVTGGIPGYTFQWSNESTDEDLSSITEPGDYTVTITDACGHSVVQTFTITAEDCPCELFPTAFYTCNGMETMDLSDDVLDITINATATNPGASGMFNAFDASTSTLLGTFSYGSGSTVTVPYTSNIDIYFEDADDTGCNGSVAFDSIAPCSPLPQPIPCLEPSVFYQVYQGTDFVEYNPNTLSYNEIYTNSYEINAIGYNIHDGYIYGIKRETNHLVRVGSDGIFIDLGAVSGLPVPTHSAGADSWYSGDFDADGNLFVGTGLGHPYIYSIDVDVFPYSANAIALTGGTMNSADFSFLPGTDNFYGLSGDEVLISISTTGVVDNIGTVTMPDGIGYGASYADAAGALYFFNNATGDLFQVDKDALTGVLFDDATVIHGSNDGASCPYTTFCEPSFTCSDDMNVTLDGTGCEVVVNYELDARVCFGYTLTQTAGLPSGSAFPLGTTVVTYELSNEDGTDVITCSFNVNVSNVAPTAADYVLSGRATAIIGEGNCYQLTTDTSTYQKGSIYYQARLNLDYDFQLDFEINLGSVDADGADGMMFILQPISSSLGTSGGSLGFGGIGASVGIEFDTWQNSFAGDPYNDHISFQRNGDLRHNAVGYLDDTVIRETVPNMEVGSYRPVTITWNAATKELTYIYNNRPAKTVTQDIANTIFGGNPNVFWGWSASTGANMNNQSVCITNVSFVEGLTVDATITDISCEEDGMIDLTVTGGIPGYTFQWSNESTDEDLSSITEAGDYTVTITDDCGHSVVQTFTITGEDCNCEITPTLVQEGCDNMGTSDTSDDIITLYVDATSVNGSGSFNVLDGSTILGTFTYGSGGMITIPYAASISLIYEDAANPECNAAIAIDIVGCEYCTDLNINIQVDNYPKETTWELVDENGNVIQDSNGHLGQNPDGTIFDYNFCLPDGCYEFIIYDSYGDGICCDPFYGDGSYTVTDMTSGTTLGQGGQFGSSETTSFCFGETALVSCTYETLKNNTFEGGWGYWIDGGEDAERMLSPGTVGNWSIRLRDNTSESTMTSKFFDLTDYTEATVGFAYRPISMDNASEDFFLEISLDGGVTFNIVEEWNQGDEFVNGRNYTDVVVIPGPFSSDTRFRFRCDAGGDGDYVFIDRVTISGCKIDTESSEAVAPVASRIVASNIQKPDLAIAKLYPNPAYDYVNIDMKSKVEGEVSINIYATTGQMVHSATEYAYEGKNQFTVNLNKLPNGTYMIEINDGKKTDIQRLIIMK